MGQILMETETMVRPPPHAASQERLDEHVKISIVLNVDLIEKLRNVIYQTPGATLSDLVEVALVAWIEAEEKRLEAIKPRTGTTRRGRP